MSIKHLVVTCFVFKKQQELIAVKYSRKNTKGQQQKKRKDERVD